MKSQQHQRKALPTTSHVRVQRTTYDSHLHTGPLRVVNPDPLIPRRKTYREVCAEQGEPLLKPRSRLLSHRIGPSKKEQLKLHQQELDRLELERQHRIAGDDFGPGSMDGSLAAQELTMEDKLEMVQRFGGGGEAVVMVEMGSTRRFTVEKQFELLRRGSGIEAKVRRGLLGYLGLR